MSVQLVGVLKNLERESNCDNTDDHEDLKYMSAQTDSCDEVSDEDF